MIRRGKRMRPFRRIAFNFCNITNTAVTFRGAAGVGRLAADAEDRNSKNCRRRRRLFKTLVVQDVITDAVLSPDIIDAAPSNRSKKKPQPTPRHCRLTGLNHALTYSTLALYLLALQKIEALSVYRASGFVCWHFCFSKCWHFCAQIFVVGILQILNWFSRTPRNIFQCPSVGAPLPLCGRHPATGFSRPGEYATPPL